MNKPSTLSINNELSESIMNESDTIPVEPERLMYYDEISVPIKVPIRFTEGSGYAGSFPNSPEEGLWPGPRGGSFIWLSCENGNPSDYLKAKQKIKLHRLELEMPTSSKMINESSQSYALYNCKEVIFKDSSTMIDFFKNLFNNPKKTLIHPVNSFNRLEVEKTSNLVILADFPFGAFGGRDPRPVIWNFSTGKVLEFDPKSLNIRKEHPISASEKHTFSKSPVFDSDSGIYFMIQKSSSYDRKYSQYRIIALIPNLPRIATFMASNCLSLDLLTNNSTWFICSATLNDCCLFYLINRVEGKLMAVFQTCKSEFKRFICLKNLLNGELLELFVQMKDLSIRKYSFSNITVETAKFDGAAGLLSGFPICDFETISFGPFDQIEVTSVGFMARHGAFLLKLTESFVVEHSRTLFPLHLADFSLFPMNKKGQNCLTVIGTDPYTGMVKLNIIDSEDLVTIAEINLCSQEPTKSIHSTPPIYIPSKYQL